MWLSGIQPACQCKRHKRCGVGRSLGEGNARPLQYVRWVDGPDGLQSIGLQRVRHDHVTEHTYTYY